MKQENISMDNVQNLRVKFTTEGMDISNQKNHIILND